LLPLLAGWPSSLRALRFEHDTSLSIGAQYGTIDDWQLSADATGNTTSSKVSETGAFSTFNLRSSLRWQTDLRDNLIFDSNGTWHIDLYEPQRLNSNRIDLLTGRQDLSLAYARSERSMLVGRLYIGVDKDETLPLLQATTLGGELAFDRAMTDHAFLTFTVGARDVDVADAFDSWDHSETFFKVEYVNVAPERYGINALPAHPRRYHPDPDRFFSLSEELGLRKSRNLIRRQGKGNLLLENITPVAPPPTEDLKIDVKIPESTFYSSLGAVFRDYDKIANQGFYRANFDVWVRWFLWGDLVLTLGDRLGWQDYEYEDESRMFLDHLENDFKLTLVHSKRRQHLRLEAGLQTFAFDHASRWNCNISRIAGSWDYYDNRRYSYSVRMGYERDIPQDERLDNSYRREFDALGTFRVHFDKRSILNFTYARERETVVTVQSEFDSSYIQDTYEMRYRKRFRPQVAWEAGYSFEQERHEIYFMNNRDEELAFLNMVVDL